MSLVTAIFAAGQIAVNVLNIFSGLLTAWPWDINPTYFGKLSHWRGSLKGNDWCCLLLDGSVRFDVLCTSSNVMTPFSVSLPSFQLGMDFTDVIGLSLCFQLQPQPTLSPSPAHSHSPPPLSPLAVTNGHTGHQPAAPCCKITSATLNPRTPYWPPQFGFAPAAKAGCGRHPRNRPDTATPPSIRVV